MRIGKGFEAAEKRSTPVTKLRGIQDYWKVGFHGSEVSSRYWHDGKVLIAVPGFCSPCIFSWEDISQVQTYS